MMLNCSAFLGHDPVKAKHFDLKSSLQITFNTALIEQYWQNVPPLIHDLCTTINLVPRCKFFLRMFSSWKDRKQDSKGNIFKNVGDLTPCMPLMMGVNSWITTKRCYNYLVARLPILSFVVSPSQLNFQAKSHIFGLMKHTLEQHTWVFPFFNDQLIYRLHFHFNPTPPLFGCLILL